MNLENIPVIREFPDVFPEELSGVLSHPDSRSDPIDESEPVSGCETIYWDFFFSFFFFKAELISVVYKRFL